MNELIKWCDYALNSNPGRKVHIENMKDVGFRINQAQDSYIKAYRQLTEGPGNLVSQSQKLIALGAKHTKQLDANLVEHAIQTDTELENVLPVPAALEEDSEPESADE